ncbi:hypothetical protein MO767_20245 [Pseudomonas sp. UYIF39]|uniref:hypothetical protein n=1 Tax=Pseudomonas sp. UYIF39 TaxID=1630747 RepID=UPI00249F09C4|nr:hypothetical protein [Pseudomonas sp. UYIF39]MDI3356659.1 hypothetical protein [Pseudomonas sp. UYIF39]
MNSQWKLVPVEPTETMVINGFESVPDECFTDEEVWEQYQEMSGCQQAAFRAKLCWAAMLDSSPAPDTLTAEPEESAGVDFGIDGRSVRVSQEAYSIFLAREAAAREKIEALQLRLNAADQRIDELTVPAGYCLMPTRLTAENGAKALLLGEFKLEVTSECPECRDQEEPSEGCEICDGEGEYGQQHMIPWDQIKFIYSEAVKGLAKKPNTPQ